MKPHEEKLLIPSIPKDELQRLNALHSYGVLDTSPESSLDAITQLASQICDTPIALISLIDEKRQWFKSAYGFMAKESARETSFCQYTILGKEMLIVPNATEDNVFSRNPLVAGKPYLKFYAGAPLIDPDGYVLGSLCVLDHRAKDLSEFQKKAMELLANSVVSHFVLVKKKRDLEKANSILENFFLLSSDFMVIATEDGYFIKISASFTKELGYSEEELTGVPFMSFVHPEDIPSTISVLENLGTRHENLKFFRNRYRRRDGTYMWISWNAYPNSKDKLIYATARDVTELVESEDLKKRNVILEQEKQDAQRQAKLKEEFLTTMSHEIRTPLNAIVGISNLLEKSDKLQEREAEYSKVIHLNSNYLLSLVNDILDLTKIDSGKVLLEKEDFNLRDNLELIYHSFENSERLSNNVKLELRISPVFPNRICSDSTRLDQVLVNLISNAIKFTEHGSIVLSATQVHETEETVSVKFSVKDSGVGIPEDKHELIFDAFVQASDSTTRVFGGTGLGLGIVKKLTELFGSKIELISSPGKGSEFYFTIDFLKSKGLQSFEKPGEGFLALNKGSVDNLNILLVEDNPFNQMVAVDTLKEWNSSLTIDVAENGNIALEKLKAGKYNLVLMDLLMPELDGYETAVIIRNVDKGWDKQIPIIAMTAHGSTPELEKCFQCGMDDFIVKPFEPDILFQKIIDALEKRKSLNHDSHGSIGN
ncbi:MAG: response regulator [Bacteroidetes bacterium]|nr:response regulator [Bacteroidota bacterium]